MESRHFSVPLREIPESGSFYRWLDEKTEVLIFKEDSKIRVFNAICPHMGSQLCYDALKGDVSCSWHGLRLCLKTGETNHLVYRKVREFSAEVQGEEIHIYV